MEPSPTPCSSYALASTLWPNKLVLAPTRSSLPSFLPFVSCSCAALCFVAVAKRRVGRARPSAQRQRRAQRVVRVSHLRGTAACGRVGGASDGIGAGDGVGIGAGVGDGVGWPLLLGRCWRHHLRPPLRGVAQHPLVVRLWPQPASQQCPHHHPAIIPGRPRRAWLGLGLGLGTVVPGGPRRAWADRDVAGGHTWGGSRGALELQAAVFRYSLRSPLLYLPTYY